MDTSEQTIPGFGQFLKNQRLARNMDLTAVSRKTKIRVVVLEQIEGEDIDNLPEPVFTKGFIKSFAEAVGADDEEAVRRYEAIHVQHAGQDQSEVPPVPSLERHGSRWLLLLLLVIVLAVVAFFILRQSVEMQKQPDRSEDTAVHDEATSLNEPSQSEMMVPPTDDAGSEKTVETETKISESDAPEDDSPSTLTTGDDSMAEQALYESASPTVASAGEDIVQKESADTGDQSNGAGRQEEPLNDTQKSDLQQTALRQKVLVVNAVELCWMKITIDENDPIEATMQAGDQAVYRADKTFKLRLGNAGGVQLTLDGEPVLVPGDSGQVRSLSLP